MFKLVLICGGPSLERGISLNSVRSFYDNIGKSENLDIKVVFVDLYLNKYVVDETFLYSNTTSDFDFKLSNECEKLKEQEFINILKSANLVMPIIHGEYGEDGTIQKILEENGIPFVASGSKSCDMMYDKANAENKILRKNNFKTIPKLILSSENIEIVENQVRNFYKEFNLKKTVIKPVKGGSSFGVVLAENLEDCLEKTKTQLRLFGKILIEQFCKGREFTVLILENFEGKPVALIPTEIEVKSSQKSKNATDENFFTTRRKYLPTNETHYYNPPRFSKEIISKIRNQAEKLFKIAEAKDFLRIDGWVLDDGEIYFSDFNPISGMEQNSFIFQQGAKVGLSHKDILEYILKSSSLRQNLKFPEKDSKKRVNILLGGITSERQVSLMSGSNVWLKLLNSKKYSPFPYLMTFKDGNYQVLPLSYDIILNHTVEEILYQYENKKVEEKDLITQIQENLGTKEKIEFIPLEKFINKSKIQDAYVFLGLHGGFGEGGDIQEMLEKAEVAFNGSGCKAAKLCMDKFITGEIVNSLNLPSLRSARKTVVSINELKNIVKTKKYKEFWEKIKKDFSSEKIVIKPRKDGCSTGVVILTSGEELRKYIQFFIDEIDIAPEGSFKMHSGPINLGIKTQEILIEEFIEVDKISIEKGKIIYTAPTKWTELTIGVLESKGKYHALNPSITIASSGVLSLEEKFQGGTGVNITPPPSYIINPKLVEKLKNYMEILCEKVGIKDYCRIDVFVNDATGEIIVIEINTLPALTSSTVIFQQAGKEFPVMNPLQLLETIISNYKN